jgi:XTP/dITP diphosphohydrolase
MKFVIATHNAHKLIELQRILTPLGIEGVTDRDLGIELPEVEETGTTFAENAYLKAASACQVTGLPAIADDSGLVVDALGGRPGVYSARYGGEEATDDDRNVLILGEMKDVPKGERSARFVASVCCVFPNGDVLRAEGSFEGEIGYAPAGENGFGYDPIFVVGDRTSAEMSSAEKDAMSHRGNALRVFSKDLAAYLAQNK